MTSFNVPTLSLDVVDRRFRGLSLPVVKRTGGYFATTYTRELIRSSIRMILLTRPGERVMQPAFGSNLYKLVFDPADTVTLALVRQAVVDALVLWEPRIRITDVRLRYDDEHLIQLDLSYTIVAQRTDDSVVVSLAGGGA
jgi:uncharacterized protein